jgi:hypothetical protein
METPTSGDELKTVLEKKIKMRQRRSCMPAVRYRAAADSGVARGFEPIASHS